MTKFGNIKVLNIYTKEVTYGIQLLTALYMFEKPKLLIEFPGSEQMSVQSLLLNLDTQWNQVESS